MRVLRLIGPRHFRWEEEERPQPGPGEVRVAVRAVGIDGSDVHIFAHGGTGETVLGSPLVLGHEFSGVIDSLGTGVDGLNPGQLVAVDPAIPCGGCEFCLEGRPNLCTDLRFLGSWPDDGALREYLVHPAALVHPLTGRFSSTEAAMLEPLGVALHSVELGRVRPGDRVSVHGCGPIGLLVVLVARLAGATGVVALDTISHRREKARELGAADPLEVDGRQVEEVMRLTQGRGVDVAFEAAGSNAAVQDAVEVAKPGGRVVLIGIPVEDVTSFRASAARHKGLTILMVRRMKRTYERCIALLEAGTVDLESLVTHRFSFKEAPEAFHLIEGRGDYVIKAMVDFEDVPEEALDRPSDPD